MGFSVTTFVFELVNFAVLLVLMQRIVYRPLRKSIDARKDAIEARERAADERVAEAEALRVRHAEQVRAIDAVRDDVRRKATEEAAAERSRLLAQARDDAAAERARAQRLLDMERDAALGWVRDVTITRSTELAGRLLLGLAPVGVERALFDLMLSEIARMAPEFAQSTGVPAEAEVTWARLPDETEIGRLREALVRAYGRAAPPRLAIREDPELGSGVTLRIGYHILDASLGGQLEALRERARSLYGEVAQNG
jgi:F-type H+-transporting ATPase subunit b